MGTAGAGICRYSARDPLSPAGDLQRIRRHPVGADRVGRQFTAGRDVYVRERSAIEGHRMDDVHAHQPGYGQEDSLRQSELH